MTQILQDSSINSLNALSKANETPPSPKFATVLTNFTPITINPALPQKILLDTFAYLVSLAQPSSVENKPTQALPEVIEKIYHYGVSPEVINQRQVNIVNLHGEEKLLADIFPIEDIKIFDNPITKPQGATISERMSLFEDVVDKVLEKAYPKDTFAPDDIIHVSCSGYLAPSPVEKMVSNNHWSNTTVTHCYHMGCYGSVPALRMATGFLAASHYGLGKPKNQIDIVHTEFLTLHLNLSSLEPRDILAMTLFGDGFIKYSVYSLEKAAQENLRGLKVLALKETIIPNSLKEMLWNLSSYNFEMILSKKIPFVIKDNIKAFVESLMLEAGLDFAKDKERLVFAIHPGGPKIIEFIQRSLKIDPQQVAFSHEILSQFGNVSSATLPYIWDKLILSKEIPIGSLVLSIAFGPGLTAAGAIMEKV